MSTTEFIYICQRQHASTISTVPLHGIILIIVTDEARYFLILHEIELGHSRKHPYHPHGGNWMLTPLPPLDVLILHLLLSETILSPLPLRTAEISSVGGVWIFYGNNNFI
jgi:hypothetical protein